MDGILILVIFGLIGLSIWGFMQTSGANEKKDAIRQAIDAEDGFCSSHFIAKVPLSTNILCGLGVDDTSKKICVIQADSFRFYEYQDLIESEVIIDGQSVTKTSRVSQFVGTAIGGILAGGVGAIIGGLSGNTSTQDIVKGVALKIIINDTRSPVHVIDFIELTNTGSTIPQQALNDAKLWHDFLSVIINQGKKDIIIQPQSVADEIQRYAELNKNGILTDEEFLAAKRKLLT